MEEQLYDLQMAGVEVIVSLLPHSEIRELRLQDEPERCQRHQIEFIWFPIADHRVPSSLRSAMRLIKKIVSRIQQGKGVAIHCRMGIGRSGMIAAGVLMMQQVDLETALQQLSLVRGKEIPETEEQRRWLARLSLLMTTQSYT